MLCRHANDSDLNKVCDLLAAEFFDDPIYKFAFVNQDGRIDRLWRFFRIYVDLAKEYGGILIAGNYAGIQVYFRPEIMTINKDSLDIDNQLRQACDSDYTHISAWMKGGEDYHPKNPPHYYLFLTAVQRTYRGKEGGRVLSTLFNRLNGILDEQNAPCYSECTRRAGQVIARRFGFYDAAPPRCIEGFPEYYPIWRNPKKKSIFSEQ